MEQTYFSILMLHNKSWRVFLGSLLILFISYAIYYFRYPMWSFFTSIEPIFVILIFSYFIVFVISLVLIRKDMKKSLSSFFKIHDYRMIFIGCVLAILFQILWFVIAIGLGTNFRITSFLTSYPNLLRGYETYTFFSLAPAFILYLLFSIFGSFTEEVAYRGYIQSRISAKYGIAIGVFIASLFFSLQHIHIFQLNWIETFFQNQFIYVFLFGIFTGYLFLKSGENIWSVFGFHAIMNVFNISFPIELLNQSIFINTFDSIISFLILILILYFIKNPSHR